MFLIFYLLSILRLISYKIKPPITTIGNETEKETGSKKAPITPATNVQIIAKIIIFIPYALFLILTF